MRKFILSILILKSITFKAQELTIGSLNNQLIHVNPSFAGLNGGLRFQSNGFYLWPKSAYPAINNYNAVDFYSTKLNGGIAISNSNYYQSDYYKYQTLNVAYAQHLEFKNGLKIIPNVQFGVFSRSINYSKLNFASYAPYPTGAYAKNNVILSSGVLGNYKNLFVGFSANNLNRPDYGLTAASRMEVLYNFHTSYSFIFSDKHLLQLSARFAKQGHFRYTQIQANALVCKHLILGLGLAASESVNTNIGFRNKWLSLTYSYIATVSKLSDSNTGNHELAIAFSAAPKNKKQALNLFETF